MNARCTSKAAGPRVATTLADFEAGRVDGANFNHAAHVHVAWQLLAEVPLLHAIARYTSALRRLTHQLGVPGKYHETITWFFILVVAERRRSCPTGKWSDFAAANPDLTCDPAAMLAKYYSPARLASEAARSTFLLPDLAPLQGAGTTR